MSKKGKLDVSFIKQVGSVAEWSNTVLKNSDQLLGAPRTTTHTFSASARDP